MKKENVSVNLKHHQRDIYNIFMYAKNPYKPKYWMLVKKREEVVLKLFKDPNTFIKYSSDMNDEYKIIN